MARERASYPNVISPHISLFFEVEAETQSSGQDSDVRLGAYDTCVLPRVSLTGHLPSSLVSRHAWVWNTVCGLVLTCLRFPHT